MLRYSHAIVEALQEASNISNRCITGFDLKSVNGANDNTLTDGNTIDSCGAQGRNRTTDTVIFSHVLYQLSYLGAGSRSQRCERSAGPYRGSVGYCPEWLQRMGCKGWGAYIPPGVAAAFTGGLKAIILWFPKDRVAGMNGWMVMLGALGALSATSPAELLLDWSGGRRGLFAILAAVTVASALTIWI